VYDLLTEYRDAGEATPDMVGFVLRSTGWACPIPEDGDTSGMGAPSRHPERRRVCLSIAATAEGVASRLTFPDTGEVLDDPTGGATGSLAEAVHTVAVDLFGRSFLRYLSERAAELLNPTPTTEGEAK
jgi:hypothetical protein